MLLLVAVGLPLLLHDAADALIVLAIIIASALLGFFQERGADRAVQKLLELVRTTTRVVREGRQIDLPAEAIVSGDIVLLAAGSTIPGDCLLLEARELSVDEAALTGETFPVTKEVAVVSGGAVAAERTNSLFMGTHVVSGRGKALVVRTGQDTELGRISARMGGGPVETDFERGVRRFGTMLMEITLVMVLVILAVNLFFHRQVLDSVLFALALAVGLTPQLLPAIISVNLSHGARAMAREKVIVKRLVTIESFGSMTVLCSDKTGTLTEGEVQVSAAIDWKGNPSEGVLDLAALNAVHQSGFTNPIDQALISLERELPYDFIRKRLSVLLTRPGEHLLITKGAAATVLDCCTKVESADGALVPLADRREEVNGRYQRLGTEGIRVLAVATRWLNDNSLRRDDENEMTLRGFLLLKDPPKAEARQTVQGLREAGVALKMITGDSRLVALSVADAVGLDTSRTLSGSELRQTSDAALVRRVTEVEVFAEVEPNQKERIILALQKAGEVVGYLGDGINDATALHAAGVGLSVDTAVDIPKSAADIVLLEKDLGVLLKGVREGRRTFANTMKYVFMASSANFGNMFSMAAASLALPFLPMLPKQILLANLLTDLPEMTIATDAVDGEMTSAPRRWDLRAIRSFMLVFGTLSSLFDLATFTILAFVLHASPELLRTGWFVESVASAALVVLSVRTRKPIFLSRPSTRLALATVVTVVVAVLIPYTPVAAALGFQPLPAPFLVAIAGIVVSYLVSAELAKRVFYRRSNRRRQSEVPT